MTYTLKTVNNVDPFFVTAETFPEQWRQGDSYKTKGDEFKKLVEFVNRCLCVYWKSLKGVNAQADEKTAANMRRELDKLASEGWGMGRANDLNEALDGLQYTRAWTDDDLSRYYGGKDQIYDKHVWAPGAFVNFAQAFDKKMKQLKGDYRDHMKLVDAVTTDADTDSWVAAKEKLAKIKGIADKVKDYGWLLDAAVIGESQATRDFMEATSKYLGSGAKSAATFVDIVTRVDATLTMYQKMRAQLGNNAGAERTAQVLAGLRLVIEFAPIIGSFYAAMLDAIPGTVEAWNKGYIAHLKRAGMARDNPRRFNQLQMQPNKKLCKHCGKQMLAPCK